ncbi:ABC transporter ATP-binding protein [Alkalihalobacillus alcalophilus ATCC 27647 = CGMCC 1.3604]|uniref:ABC transporter ATP-binding protein n=1 Tax=Alkalihalobacillus alcalophilus ATCC 27647 = CGMCC 1.3604 TaxID=1218173 RepID=J8TP28_ALKAL|nr:ABC transporter ATP-binding protein [Alkalihalobacillus alcalophilus]AFV25861.1 nitrate/sulfonate/taurine transporter [Alkalihalobacillus alcalophilus ATCC 27647 = CGMCC 1.3604]KGA95975.1 ABC transporter ATP-binding protein [Alkalihalobacillus alcalophilus ATCC 27647 = CGMCC 1.3604]MED1562074.1 ABC transporter ATP-binding protein [Alkalihalobacillus alcalophilus]THG88285.1 ABC transporter ATP-binding protein [Alkalihalobacillus alcalophilus ATCC 27647 = CGMCC 1.3604]
MTTKLELNNVGKIFNTKSGDVQALKNIYLSIEPGEFLSVVGPSGCGKSTIMRIIAGLEKPSSGEVVINETPLKKIAEGSAVVFQKDVLLAWRTILENVLFPLEVKGITWFHRENHQTNRSKALELLESVGLKGFEDKYPHELSGGMRQRVSICRALIQDPKLLLMDEPFGALDALTREQMMYDLLKLSNKFGFTTVFITHSIEEAIFLSDKVVVMSGRPGTILKEIPIRLNRPRNAQARRQPAFDEHVQEVRTIFKSQGILAEA